MEILRRNAVVKNQGTKQREQRTLGECWQWETNGQCSERDNCSFRHDINKRGKVTPSNPSEGTLNASHSFTSYEPNVLTFGELNDSSVPFSFKIPAADLDVDDLTLGKMLTEAYRGQVDCFVQRGVSVSQ